MSADLFAAFDSSFETPKQPQQKTAPSGPSQFPHSAADPFSFLQPSTGPAEPQSSHQTIAWPSHKPQQPTVSNHWGGYPGFGGPVSSPKVTEDEDDGWGDFETATQNAPPAPAPALAQSAARPTTRIVRASTLDLMTNSLISLGPAPDKPEKLEQLTERPSWESSTRQSTESRPKSQDPNVLFDADDFNGEAPPDEDDDDFGDFEAAAPQLAPVQPPVDLMSTGLAPQPTQARQAAPSQLLSTLTTNDGLSAYPQAPKSPSFQERNPFPGLGLKTPVAEEFPSQTELKSPSPVTAWPSFEEESGTKGTKEENSFEAEWAAFKDSPSKVMAPVKVPKPITTKVTQNAATDDSKAKTDWDWDDWGTSTDAPQAPNTTGTGPPSGPPPTNIPPPSILLSIFPSLLSAASTSLFKPTAAASSAVREKVHSSPATIRFLRGYLALATVAARIIAGRRLRWHRDKFLSQSMTISAATGGKGGMKLAGIDKSQSTREDREAADVVAAWKDVVGRLRTAVAAANAAVTKQSGSGALLRVPELAESMKVETVKGAMTAPRPCVVCGLKRDERVAKVDFDVEDSFGEWWVEFWGHKGCRNFWVEHEAALRSR